MTTSTLSLNDLPDDNFGLLVENDIDRRKLLWLLNTIGEKKLRASAEKRNKYYPDSPLFVSVILKRFNLKVPLSVYAPMIAKIPRFYILATKDRLSLKVGITNRWPDRVYDFFKTANYPIDVRDAVLELFDADLSLAFECASEDDARLTERTIKKNFKSYRIDPPDSIRSSRCPTEWFAFEIYYELFAIASKGGQIHSLGRSLSWSEITEYSNNQSDPYHQKWALI